MNDRGERGPAEMAASNPTGSTPPDQQLSFLEGLLAEHATIAGDVIELGEHTWAIHGSIAVDGDEILAEFETESRARMVLGQLPSAEEPGDLR